MNQTTKSAIDEALSFGLNDRKEALENPKVSIVVPAYNTENYISKCIMSLVNQTLNDIEIIVINDGSTDKTLEIVQKFEEFDKRIRIINQENQKQGAARNRGMEIAKGEYVGFVDSDDWVDLDYFEKLYLAAKKHNSDIALATNVRIGNGKTKKRLNIEKEEFVTSLQDKIDISHQAKNPCPTNKIYRKEMLEKNNIKWSEGVYCEDKLFTIQAIYYANGLVTVPEVNYYYFRNPNSTVNTKAKKHFINSCHAKENAKRAVLDFLKMKNAKIRDKEFWASKKSFEIHGIRIWNLEESIKTEKLLILGISVFSCENRNFCRIQKFLGELIRTEKLVNSFSEKKTLKIFSIPIIKRFFDKSIFKYYFFNIPFAKVDLEKNLYKKIRSVYKKDFDDAYLLNSNSGEMFLFFAYFAKLFIEKNNSKKPLFVATRKYHLDMIKMYFPEIPHIYIKNQTFYFAKDSWIYNNTRFFLLFPRKHFNKVEIDINKNELNTVHYFDNIKETLNLEEFRKTEPIINERTFNLLERKLSKIKLNTHNFIILAPEAKSCTELRLIFWEKLALQLRELGYDIFLNITDSKNKLIDCKTTNLSFEEIYYLTQKAKAIISVRSGISEFVSPTGTPNITIYTPFRRKKWHSFSTDKVLSGFSIKRIPKVNTENIYEFNIENFSEDKVLHNEIIKIVTNLQIKEKKF